MVEGEDVPGLLRMLRQARPHELQSMSDRQYRELLEKIVYLHAEARAYPTTGDVRIQIPKGVGMTPRVFSRSIVSALEAIWFERMLKGGGFSKSSHEHSDGFGR